MIDTTKIFPVDISIIKTLRSDGRELASRVYETWADGVFEWVLRVSLQVRSKKRSQPQKSASRRDGKKGGGEKGFVLEPASKLGRYSDHWRLLRSDKVLGKGSIQLLRFFFI